MRKRLTPLLLAGGLMAGCSSSDSGPKVMGMDGGPTDSKPGGNSDGAPGNGTIRELTPAAMGGAMFTTPFDATLSPDGKTAFFTAIGAEGEAAAIFRAGVGDGSVRALATGGALVSPFGLDITSDGKTLIIADPGAEAEGEAKGVLFTLSADGGEPQPIMATAGYAPRGVVVINEGGTGQIYFTGSVPADDNPGVFRLTVGGQAVTTVAKEAPFVDPSGIAAGKGGVVYVADTSSLEGGTGARIIRVQGGTASVLVEGLMVGYPAGIALSQDEKTLLISALDPTKRTDVVLRYNVDTKATESVSMGIDTFSEPAGLHRAKNADTYIWADSAAGMTGGGTVFVINPQR